MATADTLSKIIDFFEHIEKYYNCKTAITEGLYATTDALDARFTTWNLSEFILIRSAYRNNGDRFMFEGEKMYYEIAANIIIDFKQPGRHQFEFVEQYSDTVFRITKIEFDYRY